MHADGWHDMHSHAWLVRLCSLGRVTCWWSNLARRTPFSAVPRTISTSSSKHPFVRADKVDQDVP